jgi:hypothetical protein
MLGAGQSGTDDACFDSAWAQAENRSVRILGTSKGSALHAATVSLATAKWNKRAVLPPRIPGSGSGAGLACSSSGSPARISTKILRDWGSVDSLCG